MKTPQPDQVGNRQQEGFSLVMALIFISLLSVMVVGFLTTMRIEVATSGNNRTINLSKGLAQAATDLAMARLKATLGTVTGSGNFSITQPGQIVTFSTPLSSASTTASVPLHSGVAELADSADLSADLNDGSNYLLTTSASQVKVRWIYLRKDGTLEPATASAPSYDAANPLVGRFAFWVDDESSRINLNTAYTRNATTSQVNLSVFSNSFPLSNNAALDAVVNYRWANPFNTVNEARAASATLASLINASRYTLTAASSAPDLNMFGQPRIVLTTQRSLAGGHPFLDILLSDNLDPGLVANIDAAKYAAVISSLSNILTRTDWPYGLSTATLKDKYELASGRSIRPQTIGVNIIDYVRAKESQTALVQPTRGTINPTTGVYTYALDDSSGYMSNNRGMRVTEIKLDILNYKTRDKTWPATLPGAVGTGSETDFDVFLPVLSAELHLSTYSGLTSVDLTTLSITATITPNSGTMFWNLNKNNGVPWGLGTPTSSSVIDTPTRSGSLKFVYFSGIIDGVSNSSSLSATAYDSANNKIGILNAGGYAKVMLTMSSRFAFMDKAPSGSTRNPFRRWDVSSWNLTVIIYDPTTPDSIRLDSIGPDVPYSTIYSQPNGPDEADHTIAVDDPYVNRCRGDWIVQTGANITWAQENTSIRSVGSSPTLSGLVAPQDLDANGRLTNIGCRFPAPAGTTAPPTAIAPNPYGVIESVAELGYVHTGTERTNAGVVGGVPYRTLRFQPLPSVDSSKVPDWVLLDMFSVPNKRWVNPLDKALGTVDLNTYSQPLVTGSSYSGKIDGQINLNGVVQQGIVSTGVLTRSEPLTALFLNGYDNAAGSSMITVTSAATLKDNVYNKTLASNGSRYGFGAYFVSRGEIAELSGMADGGEDSESRLRVIDQATVVGNIFRIYSIGQVVTQGASAPYTITVQGERRDMTIVERVVNAAGTQVEFNTLYYGKPQ